MENFKKVVNIIINSSLEKIDNNSNNNYVINRMNSEFIALYVASCSFIPIHIMNFKFMPKPYIYIYIYYIYIYYIYNYIYYIYIYIY